MQSFSEMVNPEGISWELIVVDNNSKDKTRALFEEYKKKAPWDLKYIFEAKQGLSRARNRGIQHAQGKIVAFTDDDVIVDRHWISNIYKSFAEYPVGVAGGKILPVWETPKPNWLVTDLYPYLALLDLGDQPIYLKYPEIIYGANFAVQAELFRKYGGFNPDLGRIGQKLFCHEELDFIHRLHKGGEKILYHPKILVHHCISRKRLSKSYFRRWRYNAGASGAVLLKDLSQTVLLKVSCYQAKELLFNVLLYTASLMSFSSKRFIYELKIIDAVSFFWHKFVDRA